MGDKERLLAGALVTLLLFVAPGYLLHVSPRFPGSLMGSMLGVAGAVLLILVLVYPAVKYVKWINVRVTRRVPLRRLLTFHVYAGILGALLGILHSGHKYDSPLGISLVTTTIVVVLSGFVGRYYLAYLTVGLRQQEGTLAQLRNAYNKLAADLAGRASLPPAIPVVPLVGAIADLEYTIGARETAKRLLGRWMVIHVTASVILYLLLGLHIWSGIYFGLRWLP
jgi:uncharacterized membrane protein YsdA (DUF1294 family)